MKPRSLPRSAGLAAVGMALSLAVFGAGAQIEPAAPAETPASPPATTHARGSFEVKLTPQPAGPDGAVPGRMSVEKTIHGDLEGTSRGEMLAAMTAVEGSAGYVAIEVVTGTLAGRSGSFVLQHSGIMTRGAPSLSITVVPDSGTDQLTGLDGTMSITITEAGHFYDFEYSLTPPAAGSPH